MSTTTIYPPHPARQSGPDTALIGTPPVVAEPRRHRPRLLLLAAIALIALGALGGLLVYDRSTHRIAVLAIARAVPQGHVIGAADLAVANIVADSALQPIPASQRSQIVGRTASSDLHPGTLLTRADVTTTSIPGPGQQVVPVALKPGQLPARGLGANDRVLVVATPGADSATADSTGIPLTIPAAVDDVGTPDADGTVTVDLVVLQADGPRLAVLAAGGRATIIVLPRGRGQ